MTQVIVGRWGKSLAVRVPQDVAEACGLREGGKVEIEARGGELVFRRPGPTPEQRARARKATEEIIRDRKGHTLAGLSIRDLINEGRR